jgi:catecholate siderophore receptor
MTVFKKPTTLGLALCAVLAGPVPALAQTAEVAASVNADEAIAPKKDPVVLDAVTVKGERDNTFLSKTSTVGAKFDTPTRDIPQQVTVLTKALMQSQGANSLYRALDNIPGIVLTPSADTATGNNISLRGFPARTDIFLDGFRDRGQYFRDTFDLESVEVLEGSASLLFGHGSTGGIINQVSKRPQLAPIGDVSLSLGTDHYYRGTADYGHALGKDAAFRLNLMGQDIDGTRDTVNASSYGVAPSIAFGLGTPTTVNVSLLSQHNDDHVDYGFPLFQFKGDPGIAPLNAPFDRTYQYQNAKVRTDVNVASIGIAHVFTPSVQLRSNTQYGSYNVNQNTSPLHTAFASFNANGQYVPVNPATFARPTGAALDALSIPAQEKQRSARDGSLFNQTDVQIKFDTASVKHELVVGAEVGRDEYRQTFFNNYNFNLNNGAGLDVNLPGVVSLGSGNTQSFPTGPNVFSVPGNVTVLNADTLAAYFNDTLSFGEHYKLVAGLRWDNFSADQMYSAYTYPKLITSNANPANTATVQANNAAAVQQPTVTVLNFEHRDYLFSPRVGLIWQPRDWQSYYASYSSSFNPQALEGTATTGQLPTTVAQINAFVNGGGLKPEASDVYEIGSKLDLLGKRLSVTGAVFEQDKHRTRFTDPVTGNIGVNGEVRVRGAELKLAGRLAPGWQALVSYTYLDGKIVSSPIPAAVGKVPPELAKNSAALWTTYEFKPFSTGVFSQGIVQLGGGVKFSSRQYVVNSGYTLYGSAPGYTRLDATVAYLAQKWDLRLNLENLTDRNYYAAVNAGRAVPGYGRRATFTGGYHFY